ncbi:MAG TPA: glycosyltransferase family 2 protein [Chitinophagales bacterium]|nr:glycosyltransferase family 2 protein [Chitinophagales bacterium]HRK28097.1 glycosyltransferase family 2 protein [Chitinophagales bacterium]
MRIAVVIPTLNEAGNIGKVIAAIPPELNAVTIVADNGSTDNTVAEATAAGAMALHQPQRGYGSACLKALSFLANLPHPKQPDVVVFIDGDCSDDPTEIPLLLQPIVSGKAELVIGSRTRGNAQPGSMTLPQRFGNWLATRLLYRFYGVKFTDLGPFRAITWQTLQHLQMQDPNFGWTVEMQLKAAKARICCTEVPVSYKRRASGKSKISGTVKGTILAGYIILRTLFRYR